MKNFPRLKVVLCILPFLLIFFSGLLPAIGDEEVDQGRNELLARIISTQLPLAHFSGKAMDDNLAKAAFGLYIKQLDYQKRFLLQIDVDQLGAFAPYIDDNLKKGKSFLPEAGYIILNERISQVEKLVQELLDNKLDFSVTTSLETDPEKNSYAKNPEELIQRWTNILKYQLINKYLELEEEQEKAEEKKSEKEMWQECYEKVAKRNNTFFHRLHQETLQDHYDRFFNSVTKAFDPHTTYISPAEKEQFDIVMRGSLEGIGAMLKEDYGTIKVDRIIPGSASFRQGQLAAGDSILQVAQGDEEPVDVTDMRLREAVRLIRGPKGTEVRLTVRKADGAKEIIPIIRDVVQIEETFVKSAIIDTTHEHRVGYLQIPSFYRDFEKNGHQGGRNSSDDTRKGIRELRKKGAKAIILDLRNNGGGAFYDAVQIAGQFIDYGPVVQVKHSNGQLQTLEDDNYGVEFDGPVVVLVNKFSASASEIVAAALQDYGRAIIIGGPHTHGKGTVQQVIDLNENIPLFHLRKYDDLGAIKVMIQKFYRVTGGSTQYKGVEPDIVLPSLFKHIESGERYLEYSLPWDSIKAAEYTPLIGRLKLDNLRNRSLARVAGDEGFQVIVEESIRAEERSKDTIIALDIDHMREKRVEARQARDKVGSYLRRYREDPDEEPAKTQSEKERRGEWLAGVKDDPYVREAVNVLADMIQP